MIMGIEEKINADVKASMLARDAKRLEAVSWFFIVYYFTIIHTIIG